MGVLDGRKDGGAYNGDGCLSYGTRHTTQLGSALERAEAARLAVRASWGATSSTQDSHHSRRHTLHAAPAYHRPERQAQDGAPESAARGVYGVSADEPAARARTWAPPAVVAPAAGAAGAAAGAGAGAGAARGTHLGLEAQHVLPWHRTARPAEGSLQVHPDSAPADGYGRRVSDLNPRSVDSAVQSYRNTQETSLGPRRTAVAIGSGGYGRTTAHTSPRYGAAAYARGR